ncbi:MAG: hypothetical protein V7761_10875 [Amylibacter sp.]
MSTISYNHTGEYDRYSRYLSIQNNESDRGLALIAISLLDEILTDVLRAYLLKGSHTKSIFNGPNALVSSFYNKLNLCRALALISENEYIVMDCLRAIRNHFAHSLEATFDDKKLNNTFVKLRKVTDHWRAGEQEPDPNRRQFADDAIILAARLNGRSNFSRRVSINDREFDSNKKSEWK